jgi:hypothetical protein
MRSSAVVVVVIVDGRKYLFHYPGLGLVLPARLHLVLVSAGRPVPADALHTLLLEGATGSVAPLIPAAHHDASDRWQDGHM